MPPTARTLQRWRECDRGYRRRGGDGGVVGDGDGGVADDWEGGGVLACAAATGSGAGSLGTANTATAVSPGCTSSVICEGV